ncbi:MAG: hypothetical protein AAB288_13435, partial [Acidobacteriota bacterium]
RTDEGPRPKKAKAALIVMLLLAMGFVSFRFYTAPSMFSPHRKVSYEASRAKYAAEANKYAAAKQRKQADALDSLIHQMERTDAGSFGNRDFFRATIYVLRKTVPEKRLQEAWNDLVRVAIFAPVCYSFFKDEKFNTWVIDPDFESLPFAVRETFISFHENYLRLRKECIDRGTIIEEEAKKELGE